MLTLTEAIGRGATLVAMEIEKFGLTSDIQELLSVRDHIDALVETQAPADATFPRADLFDRGDAFQLLLEVPGVAQESLEIALEGDELVVAGLRDTAIDGTLVFSERPAGRFQRSVRLPSEVDHEQTTAHLMSGLLTITLPKT